MVSFDNVDSFALKGAFIAAKGCKLITAFVSLLRELTVPRLFLTVRGFATWEAGGDYNNLLLNSVRRGAGFSPV